MYFVLYEKLIIILLDSNVCFDILICLIVDMRFIILSDEKERYKKQFKQFERKVYIIGDIDLFFKYLFDRVVEDKKNL